MHFFINNSVKYTETFNRKNEVLYIHLMRKIQ